MLPAWIRAKVTTELPEMTEEEGVPPDAVFGPRPRAVDGPDLLEKTLTQAEHMENRRAYVESMNFRVHTPAGHDDYSGEARYDLANPGNGLLTVWPSTGRKLVYGPAGWLRLEELLSADDPRPEPTDRSGTNPLGVTRQPDFPMPKVEPR